MLVLVSSSSIEPNQPCNNTRKHINNLGPLSRYRGELQHTSDSIIVVHPQSSLYIHILHICWQGSMGNGAGAAALLRWLALGHMGVSKYRGTPKSSILIGFSIINHRFWGTPIFGNTHMVTGVWSSKTSRAGIYPNVDSGRLMYVTHGDGWWWLW